MNRGDRVAAADDDGRAALRRIGDGARDSHGALLESLLLEDAHRAVPDDRLRVLDFVGEEGDRLRADVESDEARVCELDGDSLAAVQRVVAVNDLMVCRKNQLDAFRLGAHLYL